MKISTELKLAVLAMLQAVASVVLWMYVAKLAFAFYETRQPSTGDVRGTITNSGGAMCGDIPVLPDTKEVCVCERVCRMVPP